MLFGDTGYVQANTEVDLLVNTGLGLDLKYSKEGLFVFLSFSTASSLLYCSYLYTALAVRDLFDRSLVTPSLQIMVPLIRAILVNMYFE